MISCATLCLNIRNLLFFLECFVSKLDLAFVVDGSGRIGQEHFDISKEFIKDIVEVFEIGPERIRVGLIQYGVLAAVEFQLNEYMDESSVLAAIDNIV